MDLSIMINEYISRNLSYLHELAFEICEIPSMTGKEEKKALFVKQRVEEITGEKAEIDDAGNVKYLFKGESSEKILILAAHIDTVFKDLYDIKVIRKDNLAYAPSIGDNSMNAAALVFAIRMFKELNISVKKDILFVFDVGEEGAGNLRGIRKIMEDYGEITGEVIAVDGIYKSIVNRAVGSKRYTVTVKTEGGHSWGAFGNDNAIVYLSKIIDELYSIVLPEKPRTTYNVGLINGGTSVNTIAEHAEAVFDLRSEDKYSLIKLDEDFKGIIDRIKSDKVRIDMKLLGERPTGVCNENSSVMNAIIEVRNEMKLDNKFNSSSTDANIPLSMGIPAVSFGVYIGGGSHTENEYLDLDTLDTGLRHLLGVVFKLVL